MISLIQEITPTASSLFDRFTGITAKDWIVVGVFAAWMSIIYIFAFRCHKVQQMAEEKRQRELLESPPLSLETRQEEFKEVEGGV